MANVATLLALKCQRQEGGGHSARLADPFRGQLGGVRGRMPGIQGVSGIQGDEMDPVTMGAVLLAVLSGAGEGLGGKLWDGMVTLVRRPFRKDVPAGDSAGVAVAVPGDAELAALQQAPGDQQRAVALAEVLLAGPRPIRSSGGRWKPGGSRPSRSGRVSATCRTRSAAVLSTGRCCRAGTSATSPSVCSRAAACSAGDPGPA